MLYKNAFLFTDKGFVRGSFRVEDGQFTEVLPIVPDEDGIDLQGDTVIPGLVDIHIHGAAGADCSDGDCQGLHTMARHLASRGVTSFAATTMTLPYDTLIQAFSAAKQFSDHRPEGCARLLGIHMEGPYFSDAKKGAQNPDYLQAPDTAGFLALRDRCGGLIGMVDLAPELPGAEDFIRAVRSRCTVSVAHTNAAYEEAATAFDAGASHLTHLFNCMPPIHHRAPGVIGAAAERQHVTAELICDGFHVHPSAVRMAFQLFPGRICLISDGLRCCGMADGNYELGGQTVCLKDGVARLADGTLAGAASDLFTNLRNAVAFGIPKEAAIRAATAVPAAVIGKSREIGSIAPGYAADFIVCTEDLQRKVVYVAGVKI